MTDMWDEASSSKHGMKAVPEGPNKKLIQVTPKHAPYIKGENMTEWEDEYNKKVLQEIED